MDNFSWQDILYMQRALQLASLGAGYVRPNPMVGCVIVENDEIIGEGWHQEYGKPHAEVNAVNSVAPHHRERLRNATFYVTLEPCSHFGKTPPCTDLLLDILPKRVVICQQDPFPKVNGRGIALLRQAGIEVNVGLLHEANEWLNRRFLTSVRKQRPYIVLKWAQTANGFFARSDRQPFWISDEYSRKIVHRWRTEEHAIMVGTQTALSDNPSLTVRHWKGQNPIRLLIDKQLKVPTEATIYDNTAPTICFNLLKDEKIGTTTFVKLPEENFLVTVFEWLHQQKIQSVLVEGGAKLLTSLIETNLWDEARVIVAPHTLENGIPAPLLSKATLLHQEPLLNDHLLIYRNHNG